ncbi:MAG TPA: hypothetical protein VIC59_11755, partial [Gemmatimonadota bacterium]
ASDDPAATPEDAAADAAGDHGLEALPGQSDEPADGTQPAEALTAPAEDRLGDQDHDLDGPGADLESLPLRGKADAPTDR